MPFCSGRVSVLERSFSSTRLRALPVRSHCTSSAERKTRASSHGSRTLLTAGWALSRDERAFAFRLARSTGLSSERILPSCERVHVPVSPQMRPPHALHSTSQKPCLVKTSRSTS